MAARAPRGAFSCLRVFGAPCYLFKTLTTFPYNHFCYHFCTPEKKHTGWQGDTTVCTDRQPVIGTQSTRCSLSGLILEKRHLTTIFVTDLNITTDDIYDIRLICVFYLHLV